jgi:hypothetical protein
MREGLRIRPRQIHRSKARSSASFGQRQAQLHNQDAGKQVAVELSGLQVEDVGQNDVDAPVAIAAGEATGIFDADALLQLSLASVQWGGVAGDHEVANVVDIDGRCSAHRLDQPQGGRTLACGRTIGE